MSIQVEFYGIPRRRAGTSQTEIASSDTGLLLADILTELGERFPGFTESCMESGRLNPDLAVNLAGETFVTNLQTRIPDGQTILIMSADAGG